MSLNKVEITGGLVREPDVGFSEKNGVAYWRASLAVNDAQYDYETRQQIVKTIYVSALAFGSKAERLIESGVDKGDELYVRGRLDQSVFVKKDGTKENKTRVEVQSFDIVRTQPTRVNVPGRQAPPSANDPWPTVGQNQQAEPPF